MSDTVMVFRARLLTVSQVADRLQVHRRTILNWIEDGRLDAVDIGAGRPKYRINESALAKVCKKVDKSG